MTRATISDRIDIQFAYANGGRKARYYGSNVAKADEKMAGLFCHAVQQFNYHLGNSEMYDALPFMAWLDFKGDAKAMKNTQKDLDYIMQTWLDEHRAKADQMRGDAINNTRDFLDVLVMMEKLANSHQQSRT
ncbi:hypothetical protein Scep_003687 [Stephania cephalantha]|uniref:Uncharacterized protein n=1 Tax=Stephania cephalantha TaxID=152367 RepID=A0AAP0KSG7_9MAGN